VSSVAPLPAIRVVRGGVGPGTWELTFARPHPALAPYVGEYCGYHERTPGPARRREMPAAQVVVIIDFGPTLRLLDDAGTAVVAQHAGGFVAGIDDGFTMTETTGAMEGIQVNFTPIGARRFLGRPLHDLARQVVSLADALGPWGAHLAERLHEIRGWPARFRLLDQLILGRVQAARDLPPWLAVAWERIERSAGAIQVSELVAQIGYSRKHLAAVFGAQIGMTPKALARLVRFQRALEALRSGPVRDLAQLSVDLGYFDQAHFTREFRGFSGLTPGQCLSRQDADTLGIAG
jgi:AraC-like DNA-binding protein